MRNVERLQAVLDNLNSPKIKQDQGVWATLEPLPDAPYYPGYGRVPDVIVDAYDFKPMVSCATAGCIAGTACMQAGDLISVLNLTIVPADNAYMVMNVHPAEDVTNTVGVPERARELLGLNDRVADALFEAENKAKHLKVALQMLIDGEPDENVADYLGEYNDMVVGSSYWYSD